MKNVIRKVLVFISIVSIILLTPINLIAAENGVIEKEGENLVVNGDCTQGLTGWTGSENWRIISDTFIPKPVSSATMYQDILVDTIPIGTELKLSAEMVCYGQSPIDVGTLTLEYLNADKTEILSSKSVTHASSSTAEESVSLAIPKNAKYARVSLHGDRYKGTDLNAHFKNIKLRTITYAKEYLLKVVMEVNENLQLSVAEELNENLNMTWSSSDESVATVDKNGVVTAIKKGNTTITVKNSDETYIDVIHILVVDDATDLRLAIDMKVGTKRRVTIDDLTETKQVTWYSMDSDIAAIDAKGKVTAVKKGLVLVTATDENGEIVGTIYVRVRN